MLSGPAKAYIKSELLKLKPNERLNPTLTSRILADAQRLFYEQDAFKTPSLWYGLDPSDKKTFKQRLPIPIGNTDTYSSEEGWTIGVQPTYDLESWSYAARPYFVSGASGSKKGREGAFNYLENNFVISEASINTLNEFLVTGDMSILNSEAGKKLQEDLNNVKFGLDNNLTKGEIAQSTIKRFYGVGKGKPPILTEGIYDLLNEKTEVPVNRTGTNARDENLFVYSEYLDSQHGIEFKVQLGNGLQTANNIFTPFSGKVKTVGSNEKLGTYVLIESDSDLIGVPKGTQILLSRCGSTSLVEGQNISRGDVACIGGDHSVLPNSTEGSTTGSNIESGHLVIQFLYPEASITDDGEISAIPITPVETKIPSGAYDFPIDTQAPGYLPEDLQMTLFFMYFQNFYSAQDATSIQNQFTEIDLDNDLFYKFPITTE